MNFCSKILIFRREIGLLVGLKQKVYKGIFFHISTNENFGDNIQSFRW